MESAQDFDAWIAREDTTFEGALCQPPGAPTRTTTPAPSAYLDPNPETRPSTRDRNPNDVLSARANVDYVPTPKEGYPVYFLPGETAKWVKVAILPDDDVEYSELFDVVLFDPTNAIIEKGEAIGTIRDDD